MSFPKLPVPAPGEVLLVCTCYEEGRARWGGVMSALGGQRDGDAVVLRDGEVRLRLAEDPRWDYLQGGHLPALVEADAAPPVAAVVDIPVVYGGEAVLLVDLQDVPGRGVRVQAGEFGRVVAELLGGSLGFDELVRGMDSYGVYLGDGGAPAIPTSTTVVRAWFPRLPASEATLLVRTDFTDDRAWHALVDVLGNSNEDGRPPTGEEPYDEIDLEALIVDDRAFEHLQPGQAPALVPPDEHTAMVALADAATMADPARPLLVVDLYDTPGQATRIPLAEAGSMAINLEIGNMDFADFV